MRQELRGPKRQNLYLPRGVILPQRWRPIDYHGTRPTEGQAPYLPRGVIHPWDDHPSTTTVLELLRDKFPISRKSNSSMRWQPVNYYEDTRLLFPKRIYSSMRWQFVDYYGTRLNLRQDLNFPRGFIHPWGDNSSTTMVLDSSWGKISITQEESFIHEVTTRRLLCWDKIFAS